MAHGPFCVNAAAAKTVLDFAARRTRLGGTFSLRGRDLRFDFRAIGAALALAVILPASVAAQDSTPADAAAARARSTVQDYDPAPAMWRLADEDTTIYLLGTVHLLPEGFRWRSAQIEQVLGEVDALVLESSDPDADASMAHMSDKFANLLASRRPTSQQLSPAARSRWRRLVALTGQNFDAIDRTPLMVALMGFGMDGIEQGPSDREYGVETVLEEEFSASGRPVLSIEDTGRVMMSLYRISDSLVLPELERDLLAWDGSEATLFLGTGAAAKGERDFSLEHAWARGEVQDSISFGIAQPALARAFNNALLTSRNRRWAAWLDERLDMPGKILVAVGAGHFEGPDSVLAMLRERGLEAERITRPVE